MSDEGKGKGGSYPNHSGMKYELPFGYVPLPPPSDAYREGWERIFGKKDEEKPEEPDAPAA